MRKMFTSILIVIYKLKELEVSTLEPLLFSAHLSLSFLCLHHIKMCSGGKQGIECLQCISLLPSLAVSKNTKNCMLQPFSLIRYDMSRI